jgi:hypothetical protein
MSKTDGAVAANTVYGNGTTVYAADGATVSADGSNNGVVMDRADVFVDGGETLHMVGSNNTVTISGPRDFAAYRRLAHKNRGA